MITKTLKLKNFIGGLIILMTVIWFIVNRMEGAKNERIFYENEISSVVINTDSYFGRTIEVQIKSGFNLYFWPSSVPKKIAIGDSIHKSKNTFFYKVSRKDDLGQYPVIGEYYYPDVN